MEKIQTKIHNPFFCKKNFNECFPILSPWIKSWILYSGYSTAGRQPPIFNKNKKNILFYKIKTVF